MPFNSASHFNVSGAGIDGVIDIASVSGEGVVSLTVDGRALRDPSLETTCEGIVVRAIHEGSSRQPHRRGHGRYSPDMP